MNLEEQLHALIESAAPHIQRHFACDCAERALRREKVKDKRLWKAVEVARRYAEGRAELSELADAKDAAWDARAARAAAWAAAWAARAAAWDEEREWQLTHLQHLLAAHNNARSSLLGVLSEHAARVQVSPSFAKTLEEALFT